MSNMTYDIRRIPRQGTFMVQYCRPSFYGGKWNHYKKDGRFLEFTSWDDAFKWLVDRNGGNVAYVVMHLNNTYVDEYDRETVQERADKLYNKNTDALTPDTRLFPTLLDAHRAHKAELDAQQMFYFLRGVLYQWCVDHGESVMDMEATFIVDIRYISTTGGFALVK